MIRSLKFIPYALVLCTLLWAKSNIERRSRQVERSLSLTPLQATYHGKSLKTYSLGFDLCISDLMWVSLLQWASHKKLDPGEVSWEFAQIDAITTLDPRFERAYDFGAIFLSVFRQDKLGAETLLRKWVKRFPRSWRAHYLLAYHLYFEMNRHDEAAKHMLYAASLEGAPFYLSSLGLRLLGEAGQLVSSLQISLDLAKSVHNPEAIRLLKRRIRAIRYALQHQLWSEALEEFMRKSSREPASIEALYPVAQKRLRELASLLPEEAPEGWDDVMNERFRFTYNPGTRAIRSIPSREELGIDGVGIYRKFPEGEGND